MRTDPASSLELPPSAFSTNHRNRWLGPAVYLGLIAAAIGIYFLIRLVGNGLTAPEPGLDATPVGRNLSGGVDVVLHVVATLSAAIGVGFLLGQLLGYVGQPRVIGEIIGGILLGPSLLGAVWPDAMHVLIPSAEVDPSGLVPAALKAVSQLGAILYMFLVGLELNAARLRQQASSAIAVSHASIVLPFVLGSSLAVFLYPIYSHSGVPFTSFSLFVGMALSITAFPVLARILTDRGLDKTQLGTVALGCAAVDDVTAWCLLAVVIGVTQAQVAGALAVAAGAVAFLVVMFVIARPAVVLINDHLDGTNGSLPPAVVSGTFLLVLLAALTTEAIGIHAVFGAFVFGAIVPHDGRLAREFSAKLKDPVTVLLLPAFFAYTGMRTSIGLLSGWQDWLWCLAVILVATIGKFGGSIVAARLTGSGWRDAAALGVLMNTRGLMELIALNIGLDLGVISPKLFAILVIMAVVTTVITSPALRLLLGKTDELAARSNRAPSFS